MDKAASYRRQAEHARQLALQLSPSEARDALERTAEEFDKLADALESAAAQD